jgi:low temperature requirement protein LtrA
MGDRSIGETQRVTPLELFFDLVVVFAFTQVTGFLSDHPTWGGLLRGLLMLSALWWAWAAYAWLTNTLDPEEGGVRLAMFGAMGAMVIVSLAVPRAFSADGVTFGIAYLVVRVFHILLYALAGRGDRDLLGAVLRIVPTSVLAPSLIIAAAFFHGGVPPALWGAAVAVDYLGVLIGHMRGWRVSPEHFVERHGLAIIIALGESIVAIGVGASGLPLDAAVIAASLLGIGVAATLWWAYFDWVAFVSQARLTDAAGAERATLARDMYSYLHLPMVGGIVLFALGMKTTLAHVDEALPTIPAVGMFGGIALYLVGHIGLRLRTGGGLARGRSVATVVLLALLPLAGSVSALTALGLVAAVCAALIAYETLRYPYARAWIRSHRGSFTMEEAARIAPTRGRRRPDAD